MGIQGSGYRAWVSEFRVEGPGFGVHGSRFRVQGAGLRVRVQGVGFRVQGWLPTQERIVTVVGDVQKVFRIRGLRVWVQGFKG